MDGTGHVSEAKSVTKEDITQLGIPDTDTVYTHPKHTAHDSGLYKVTVDSEGHVTEAADVVKADITQLGIPGTDTTYKDATQAEHGLMTAADKAKLDGLDAELAKKQDADKAYNQLAINWYFNRWTWDSGSKKLTLYLDSIQRNMGSDTAAFIGTVHHKNNKGSFSNKYITISDLFSADIWAFEHLSDSPICTLTYIKTVGYGSIFEKYFDYTTGLITDFSATGTSTRICTINTVNISAGGSFDVWFWGFTNPDLSTVEAQIDELADKISSTVGAYTWHMDTDKVYDKDGKDIGSLQSCMTSDMTGTWFFARTSTSTSGSAQYPSSYTINGANGYLSLGDFVIWTGEGLVHVSTYEAKASTVRNSDGQFAYHSGVDGLMSSTDKAYLTFLMQHFIAASMSSAFNSGDGANESGLYGNVTLGRPAGSGEGDTYNMMSILDKVTNYTSQLLINENIDNPYAYFRGRISGTWQRILSENDLVSHMTVAENDSDYPNWDNELRIYHVKKWAASSTDLPNSTWSSDGDYLVVNIPGAPNATTLHARTQFVVNNGNMEIWCRFIPSYNGSGSLASGSPSKWVQLSGGVQTHTHSNKTVLDSVTQSVVTNSHTHDNKAALDLVSSDSWGGAIGNGASISHGGGAVGNDAKVTDGGGAVGYDTDATNGGAVGNVARETGGGGAIGYYAQAGEGFSGGNRAQVKITDGKYIDAIQLGKGTNNNPLTLQVYDYQVTASTKSMAGDSGHIWLKDVGELSGLKTSDRSSIVAAINELNAATHSHSNKTALDTITQAKITSWDGAQSANCKVVMSDYIKKVEIDDINGVFIFHLTDDNCSSGNPALLQIYNPTKNATGPAYTLDSDRLSTILSGYFTVTANNLQKTVTVKPVNDCFMYIYYANGSVQASSTTINGRLIMTLRSSGMAIDSFDTYLFTDEFVNVGQLSDLQTSDKTSIVAAINELAAKITALS